MRKLWLLSGRLVFWFIWPISWFVLKTSTRGRVLIICNQEVLLVKIWIGDGKWCLPGGGLRKAEQPYHGAIREVHEETGIELKPAQLKPLGEINLKKYGLSFKYIIFVCQLPNKPSIQAKPREISEICWQSLKSLDEIPVDPSVRMALNIWQGKA